MEHIKRMEVELSELNEKIEKLEEFWDAELKNPKYTNETQRLLLGIQHHNMLGYREALKQRITYDTEKTNKD